MNHSFLEYRPISGRLNPVATGLNLVVATFYAMKNAEDRGVFFITPLLKFTRAWLWENTTGPKIWNSMFARQNN